MSCWRSTSRVTEVMQIVLVDQTETKLPTALGLAMVPVEKTATPPAELADSKWAVASTYLPSAVGPPPEKLETGGEALMVSLGTRQLLRVDEGASTGNGHRSTDRVAGLFRYLADAASRKLIGPETNRRARSAWIQVWADTSRQMPVPDACPGPDGELLYTWDRDAHHLELEIPPEGPVEFFYRNRLTEELWEMDYRIDSPLPQGAREKLALFT